MKSLPPIPVTIAIVLLLLGGYIGAYLWSGTSIEYDESRFGHEETIRLYEQQSADIVYAPAAWAESKIRGYEVRVEYRGDTDGLEKIFSRVPPTGGTWRSRIEK